MSRPRATSSNFSVAIWPCEFSPLKLAASIICSSNCGRCGRLLSLKSSSSAFFSRLLCLDLTARSFLLQLSSALRERVLIAFGARVVAVTFDSRRYVPLSFVSGAFSNYLLRVTPSPPFLWLRIGINVPAQSRLQLFLRFGVLFLSLSLCCSKFSLLFALSDGVGVCCAALAPALCCFFSSHGPCCFVCFGFHRWCG